MLNTAQHVRQRAVKIPEIYWKNLGWSGKGPGKGNRGKTAPKKSKLSPNPEWSGGGNVLENRDWEFRGSGPAGAREREKNGKKGKKRGKGEKEGKIREKMRGKCEKREEKLGKGGEKEENREKRRKNGEKEGKMGRKNRF